MSQPDTPDRSPWPRPVVFRVCVAFLAVVVAWLAFKPATGVETGLPWDKANHALAFMVLTIFSFQGWPRAGFWKLASTMLFAGVAIELVQGLSFIGRDADVWDVVADMTGFVLGWSVSAGLRRLGRERPSMG